MGVRRGEGLPGSGVWWSAVACCVRGRRAVEGDEEVGPGAEEEGEVLWKPEISDGVAVLLYASAQRKRERRCGRRRWKTKGCCGCEGVAARVWQGVLHEMGCRRTCCCNWEKERWRERGKGEEERRQRSFRGVAAACVWRIEMVGDDERGDGARGFAAGGKEGSEREIREAELQMTSSGAVG
ncbi:hypothetical protein MRB53_030784 [Persea americana]|uniref:Uncharacterized protein n=1 Tax=Persea americana TaxID=3435 RepID=A0ACC2KML2_PERAE|nr:hypothetical protein MRB53_030784 [Persea americana]